MKQIQVIIVSGPTAVGKRHVLHHLHQILRREGRTVDQTISHTTRLPREGETEKDYHFVSEESFVAMEKAGKFLEVKKFPNRWYGTSVFEFAKVSSSKVLIIEVEPTGAKAIVEYLANSGVRFACLYCLPPGGTAEERIRVLEDRLRQRGSEISEEAFQERMQGIREEMAASFRRGQDSPFDHCVINHDSDDEDLKGFEAADTIWRYVQEMEQELAKSA